jgi:heme-degrading monooxygenase HmoA
MSMNAGFAVLYRWRVRPDAEEDFIAAWRLATEAFTTIGALGSRLHRGDDGDLYAYAEWPSREAWEHAGTRSPVDRATAELMRDSTLEFEAKPLDVEADLLTRSAPA